MKKILYIFIVMFIFIIAFISSSYAIDIKVADLDTSGNINTSVSKSDSDSIKKNYTKVQILIYVGQYGVDESDDVIVTWANLVDKDNTYNVNDRVSISDAKSFLYNSATKVNGLINDGVTAFDNLETQLDGDSDKENVDKDKETVFKMPNGTGDVPNGIQDVANDASQFLNGGNTNGLIQEGALQDFSQNIYSMLLGVGIVVAVIVGLLIGIKLMLAPIEERAEAKKLLIPYIAGCAIVFGSFGIWKLVVTLLSGV